MSLLDVGILCVTAFIILYGIYGYVKEEAELPKYPQDTHDHSFILKEGTS